MPTLEELILYSLDQSYARAGRAVQYIASGDGPKDITAIFDCGKGDEYKGSDEYGIRATLRVRKASIAQPARKDTVDIDGETWGVIDADRSADGLEWIIQINKL